MPLTAQQRRRLDRLIRLQNEAQALNLTVAMRCERCGAVLTAAKSISKIMGPVCRAKRNGPDIAAKQSVRTVHHTNS